MLWGSSDYEATLWLEIREFGNLGIREFGNPGIRGSDVRRPKRQCHSYSRFFFFQILQNYCSGAPKIVENRQHARGANER